MTPMTSHYDDAITEAAIEHRYGPSSVDLCPDQVARMVQLRSGCRLLARQIAHSCPPSWERDEALKMVDEACSWSAKAIARNENGPEH